MTVRGFVRVMMMFTVLPWFAVSGAYLLQHKWAMAGIAVCYGASNLLLLFVGEG